MPETGIGKAVESGRHRRGHPPDLVRRGRQRPRPAGVAQARTRLA